MTRPTGYRRFLMLMGLRGLLWRRALSQSPGKLIGMLLGLLMFSLWGIALGYAAHGFAQDHPELTPQFVHAIAFSMFLVQVSLGVITLTVAEFFDVSRLFHLPVGYREVFAAMLVSGLLTPTAMFYAAPLIGVTTAAESPGLLAWRLLCTGLLLALGHGTALLLNLFLLSLFPRRRLRDLATIFATGVGMTLYVLWQSIGRSQQDIASLIASDPTEGVRFLPPAWVADLFLAHASTEHLMVRGVLVSALLVGLVALGSRLLHAAFLGDMPSPQIGQVGQKTTKGHHASELGVMIQTVRTIWWREPQVKALWLQQTVFMIMPVFLLAMDRSARSFGGGVVVAMLITLLPLSRLHFASSLFGLDGRGVTQLFLTPVSRWRILLARGIALGGAFLVADMAVVMIVLLAMGAVAGDPLGFVRLTPFAWVGLALGEIILITMGTVTSVYLPLRIATAGRRAIQGQRVENAGCSAQLVRMLVYLPALVVSLLLAAAALWPLKNRLFGEDMVGFLDVAPAWAALTIPLAFVFALGLYFAILFPMGDALQHREEKMVRALTDAGD